MADAIISSNVPAVTLANPVNPASQPSTEADGLQVSPAEAIKSSDKVEAPTKTKYTYKVGDKVINEELTFEEAQQKLQKVHGIDLKAQEAAELRKQSQAYIEALKNGDFSFLETLGLDSKEVVSKWLVDRMEAEQAEASLTPEQKELRAAKKELEEIRKRDKLKEDESYSQSLTKETDARSKFIIEDYVKSATAVGLPPSKIVLKKTLDLLVEAAKDHKDAAGNIIRKGVQLNPSDVMPIVKRYMDSYLSDYFTNAPVDSYYSILGKNVDKFRKAELDKLKTQNFNKTPAKKKPVAKPGRNRNRSVFD